VHCGIGSWGGQCLRMGDYVKVRPIRRRHPALGRAQRPFVLASLPAGEGGTGYGLIAFLCVMGLLFAGGIAVKVHDVKRKREDEGIALQSRLSDALLGDPALSGVPVTPTVHVPFSRRGPVVIELTGAVPSPAGRETVLGIVRRVAAPLESDHRIDDRLIVDPRMTRRAA